MTAPQARTCYCGETAPESGTFPHQDCDGSVPASAAALPAAWRKQAAVLDRLAGDAAHPGEAGACRGRAQAYRACADMLATALDAAPPAPQLMTPGEVADLFRVDVSTVARWGDRGRLGCVRTPGGERRYYRAGVEELLRGRNRTEAGHDR